MNSKSKAPDDPFITKTLRVLGEVKDSRLIVKIYRPELDNALYKCAYEIWLEKKLVISSSTTGGDSVHSLMLAFWKIETELKHKPPFNSIAIEFDERLGFGFVHGKRVWDSIYG